jgi:YTH domain-containing protein 1
VYGVESLLAAGKAAAEAKVRNEQTAPAITAAAARVEELRTDGIKHPNGQQESQTTTGQKQEGRPEISEAPTTAHPTKLADPYYEDLPIWLEMTGYHDVDYRNSKLQTFKERRALEAEAARIQQRLEKLKEDEQATIQSMRGTPVRSLTAAQARPALPKTMPSLKQAQDSETSTGPKSNGTKRAHSPDPNGISKSRRNDSTNGFRIRGANDSPNGRTAGGRGRLRSRSPVAGGALARRVSYPDARRWSPGSRGSRAPLKQEDSRDPSLERRQSYYRYDSRTERTEHNREQPRDAYNGFGHGRLSYSNTHRMDDAGGYRSTGLDLRRGGKRAPR